MDGAFCFGCGPRTRNARNLAENTNVAVHLQSDSVVILGGVTEVVTAMRDRHQRSWAPPYHPTIQQLQPFFLALFKNFA